jgi:hypothetical protein
VFLKKRVQIKKIQNYRDEFKSTLTQERVYTINFNFHDTASLELDHCQNGCEVRCMNFNNVGIPSPLYMVAGAVKLKTMQCSNSYTAQKEHQSSSLYLDSCMSYGCTRQGKDCH